MTTREAYVATAESQESPEIVICYQAGFGWLEDQEVLYGYLDIPENFDRYIADHPPVAKGKDYAVVIDLIRECVRQYVDDLSPEEKERRTNNKTMKMGVIHA